MRQILADAGYWIALRDQKDVNHPNARKLALWLTRQKYFFVVTPYIFAEVYASFSRMGNIREQIIRDIWQNPIVRVEQCDFEDQQNALDLLVQHHDKSFSFCDSLSFVVMTRMDIAQAASFDQHFHQF